MLGTRTENRPNPNVAQGTPAHDRLAALAPIYVVHALGAAEATVFEEHLTDCASCQTEVARLREVSAVLVRAVSAAGKSPVDEILARSSANATPTAQQ